MVHSAVTTNSLDEIQLVAPESPDRLPAMLFLAALIHGILIIGITFNPYVLDDFTNAISLEVTIVANPDQDIDRPDEAEYLAQASQQGGGNTTEELRATAPQQSVSPIDNLGDPFGEQLLDTTVHERAADQALTTASRREEAVPDRTASLGSGRNVG